MDLDLRKEFSGYSNLQLLRIKLRPNEYQPAAVAIAEELLASRMVTEAEYKEAEESFLPKQKLKASITVETNWQPGADIFSEDDIVRADGATTQRLRLLSLAIGIFILVYANRQYAQISRLLDGVTMVSQIDVIANLIILCLQITGLVFLLRKQSIGWILSASWLCYLIPTMLLSLLVLITSGFMSQSIFSTLEVIFLSACLFTLCSKKLLTMFSISAHKRNITLIVAFAVTVVYCVLAISWLYF